MHVDLVPCLIFTAMLWTCSAAVAGLIVYSRFGALAGLAVAAIVTLCIVAGSVLLFRCARAARP